jgi:acetate kinase
MKTLVINTGSSSIKYQFFLMPEGKVLCSGLIEKIGEDEGHVRHKKLTEPVIEFNEQTPILNHQNGMEKVARLLTNEEYGVIENTDEVELVGHRVVHGGEEFSSTIVITNTVKKALDKLADLAPLHNPANLVGIRMSEKVFTKAKQIAVFDTSYHQSIPEHAFRYAIPNKFYIENGIRAYGFHGTSHKYVAEEAAKMLKKPIEECNLISIHLGNGASITAIKNGKSIDTSLGFTTVPGLVMGTRSGDIDPGVIFYLNEQVGLPISEIKNILHKESGMKGLTGNNDLRQVCEDAENGNKDAQLGLEIYAYRVKKYIGSYMAAIGKVDALIFTAGVGENSPKIREMSVANLEHLGIELHKKRNLSGADARDISTKDSKVKIFIIPTNEELEIANQACALMSN